MKDNKPKQKDIFTEIFDEVFSLIFKLIEELIEFLFKQSSEIGGKALTHAANKSETIKKVEDVSQKIFGKRQRDIKESDFNINHSTLNRDALGYNVSKREELKYEDYDSNTPLTVITGPPGWGKTVLMMNLIHRDVSNDIPFIVIDPKASKESRDDFIDIARSSGKDALIFDFNANIKFNPLADLDESQVVEAIFRAFPNQHEYYGPRSKVWLLDVVTHQRLLGKVTTFHTILKDLDELSDKNKDIKMETQGLRTNLKILLKSGFGRIFDDPRGEGYTLKKIREEGRCVYFSLPSLAYNNVATAMGKIIISSIMNHSFFTMNEENTYKPLSIYIDEAGDFLFRDFKSLVSQCRAARVNLTIATQTISDLEEISPNFLRQMLTYAGNFWIFKASDPADAERIARYLGTKSIIKETKQTMDGSESGMGSEREVESFIVHTNLLKNLPKYKAILKQGTSQSVDLINIRNIENILVSRIANFAANKDKSLNNHRAKNLNAQYFPSFK